MKKKRIQAEKNIGENGIRLNVKKLQNIVKNIHEEINDELKGTDLLHIRSDYIYGVITYTYYATLHYPPLF